MKFAITLAALAFAAQAQAVCRADDVWCQHEQFMARSGLSITTEEMIEMREPEPMRNPYSRGPALYNEDGNFRGRLNKDRYDPDSVSNPYGRYGSKYSPDSINNRFGAGSRYAPDIFVVPE